MITFFGHYGFNLNWGIKPYETPDTPNVTARDVDPFVNYIR